MARTRPQPLSLLLLFLGAVGPWATSASDRQPYYLLHRSDGAQAVEASVRTLGGRVDYRFPRIDAIAVSLPPTAATRLAGRSDVIRVEPVPAHRPAGQVVPWNIDQYQARQVWDADRDGEVDPGAPDGAGVRLCIIDTGLFAEHDDFVGIDMDGTSQVIGQPWYIDGDGHGTHVAGIANAVHNDIGVVGVMPGGASLYAVKVFDDAGNWTPTSNLGAAAEACRDAGANVISMSLSGGYSVVEEQIFQNLYDSNVLLVAAAGNNGTAARAYPASYDSVISVAAVDQVDTVGVFSQFPDTAHDPQQPPAEVAWDVVELSGGGVNVLSTFPAPSRGVPEYRVSAAGVLAQGHDIDGAGSGRLTGALVPGGLCRAEDVQPNWSGNLVLCRRGSIAFAEKVAAVEAAGGRGAIIANDSVSPFDNWSCSGACTGTIPAIALSLADGQQLEATALGAPALLVATDGSDCLDCTGGYASLSGTSMATPGVAAGIGYLWQTCGGPSGVNNRALRQLLRDSARDLQGIHEGGLFNYGEGWDRATGWGLVQLADARELGHQRFGSDCPLGLSVSPTRIEACTLEQDEISLTARLETSLESGATLEVIGLPPGVEVQISPNPLSNEEPVAQILLSGLASAPGGDYPLVLSAIDAMNPQRHIDSSSRLTLWSALPGAPQGLSPSVDATNVSVAPTLSWQPAPNAQRYRVEIATDRGFTNVMYDQAVTGTLHSVVDALADSTHYYWRVTPLNGCGAGPSATGSFTTTVLACSAPQQAIPDNDPAGLGDRLLVAQLGDIEDLDVSLMIDHTWVGDLVVTLTHESTGTTVTLVDRPGFEISGGGCRNDDIDAMLDDDATADVETTCELTPPAIGGELRPSQPLSAFVGETITGTWSLNVSDHGNADTGSLQGWCLLPSLAPGAPGNDLFGDGFED